MYINITDKKEAENKGSSGKLVHYLEKENRMDNNREPEQWFNGQRSDIEAYEVRRALDSNNAKLGRNEAKFFLINISPSQKELAHLKEQYGESGMKEHLKLYAEKVMDEYARNFKRNGIDSSRDLLWFAKLENHRYYTHNDGEVKQGLKKRGEKKAGDQMHVQVIVSRKDITGKMKLSPMNSSKGTNAEHSKKMGQFDRVAFKQSGETLFDRHFGFERGLEDTLAYANVQKNGSLAQREQMDILMQTEIKTDRDRPLLNELAGEIARDTFLSTAELIEQVATGIGGFLSIMLEPGPELDIVPEPEPRKKKKRKNNGMQR